MAEVPAGLDRAEIWRILVETVHVLPLFKNHKRYVEDVMMKEKPIISPQELAVQLNIPLGEALVLLEELRGAKSSTGARGRIAATAKSSDGSLLDFSR